MRFIKRYICTGVIHTSAKKLNDVKDGVFHTIKDIWFSREAIDMMSALEDFNVWQEMIWEEISNPTEHPFETDLKLLRNRPH